MALVVASVRAFAGDHGGPRGQQEEVVVVVELKATIRISEYTSGGYLFEVDDARGEPYALGSHSSPGEAMGNATPYVQTLVEEDPIADNAPSPEEYVAEVARAKVAFQNSHVPPRSGVR